MILKEVDNSTLATEFLHVARELYKNDPFWVCPLDKDVKAVFDPKKNNFHSHGSCTRWVLKSSEGKLIGRISAFINENKAYQPAQATGGMGFFECINDQEAANLLFETAKNWLSERGMKAL